jgi:hypothetical protein
MCQYHLPSRYAKAACLRSDRDVDDARLARPGDQPERLQPLERVLERRCLRSRLVAPEDVERVARGVQLLRQYSASPCVTMAAWPS